MGGLTGKLKRPHNFMCYSESGVDTANSLLKYQVSIDDESNA